MAHSVLSPPRLTRRYLPISLVLFLVAAVIVVTAPAGAQTVAFPNASNTGLSNPSLLTVHSGNLTVTQDGTVLENMEIQGSVRIEAENVVMRNVWVYTSSVWTIYVDGGSLLIEDAEIGNADHLGERGIGGANVTGRRLNIHHVEDGIKLYSSNLYEWIFVHDLDSPNSGPHGDAIQAEGTTVGAVVRNAYLDSTGPMGLGNSAIILKTDFGRIDNVLIENSYLNGGNYTFYSRVGDSGAPTNVTLRNNVFGPDFRYGLMSIDGSVAMSGNTNSDGSGIGGGGSGSTTTAPPSGQFVDDESSPYEDDIELIYEAGITAGCNSSGNRFCPTAGVSRAEMATFLVRALNEQPSSGTSPFSDVASGAWYAGFTKQLYEMDLVQGCFTGPLRYCPTYTLSRAEMAVLLVRALGEQPSTGTSPFSDVAIDSWYGGYVKRLYDLGITTGCATSPSRFCPVVGVSRGEMARFLVNAFDLG